MAISGGGAKHLAGRVATNLREELCLCEFMDKQNNWKVNNNNKKKKIRVYWEGSDPYIILNALLNGICWICEVEGIPCFQLSEAGDVLHDTDWLDWAFET